MRRAKQWACTGAGPIEQWVWAYRIVGLGLSNSGFGPKKAWYQQYPPFFQLKVGTSSVRKNMVLLNLEWRKLKGLGELMCALNVCLDIKQV